MYKPVHFLILATLILSVTQSAHAFSLGDALKTGTDLINDTLEKQKQEEQQAEEARKQALNEARSKADKVMEDYIMLEDDARIQLNARAQSSYQALKIAYPTSDIDNITLYEKELRQLLEPHKAELQQIKKEEEITLEREQQERERQEATRRETEEAERQQRLKEQRQAAREAEKERERQQQAQQEERRQAQAEADEQWRQQQAEREERRKQREAEEAARIQQAEADKKQREKNKIARRARMKTSDIYRYMQKNHPDIAQNLFLGRAGVDDFGITVSEFMGCVSETAIADKISFNGTDFRVSGVKLQSDDGLKSLGDFAFRFQFEPQTGLVDKVAFKSKHGSETYSRFKDKMYVITLLCNY